MKVKIIGAGSIGNHLAQASRRKGWDVVVVDNDPKALERMEKEIYPKRYGAWDPEIKLYLSGAEPKDGFDVIMIGTPPDSHFQLGIEALKEKPRLLQIDKPLAAPLFGRSLDYYQEFLNMVKKSEIPVIVGYEYVLSESARKIADFIKQPELGEVQALEVSFREHWSGIFGAHPWLRGPQDSYLGYWKRGGGASAEHSHAIHFWQYFANLFGLGKINQVSAMLDIVDDGVVNYDRLCAMHVKTDKDFCGRIIQDVMTNPPQLSMRIQRERGYVEWQRTGLKVRIKYGLFGNEKKEWEEGFQLKRPDDFYEEICHISDILEGKIKIEDSAMNLDWGIHALKVFTAAHKSNQKESIFIRI